MTAVSLANPASRLGQTASSTPAVTVERGDTLSSIAARMGVSLKDLIAANPQIANPDRIGPGDLIQMPAGAQASAANGAAPAAASAQSAAAAGGGSAANMSVSQAGLDHLKASEGLRTTGYLDPVGVPTIGYGHTGPDVQVGQQISEAQAEDLLRQDVGWAEDAVRQNVKVPITQGQFDALVSFTYNMGAGAFAESDVLEKLNAGDYAGAQEALKGWVHAGGEVLPGLVTRREQEAAMFGNQAPDGSAGTNGLAEGEAPPNLSDKLPPLQPPKMVHTVVPGDTLWDIAKANNVSLQELIAANPQIANPDLIYPGDKVNLPPGGGKPAPLDGGEAGGPGGVGGPSGTGAPTPAGNGTGANAAAIAESFVGQNASELKGSGALPMDDSIPNDVCCANFISAVLIKNGQLDPSEHTSWVPQLDQTLRNKGWREVSPAEAKPGDVVLMNNNGHVEMVVKNANGEFQLVGSNNSNPDGSQRIGYDDGSWTNMVILTPPN